jgi:predicted Ser/Thr protein kinase
MHDAGDPLADTMSGDDTIEDRLLRRDLKQRLFGTKVPVRVSRYEIERRIAQGGMGVVYAARDPELDRKVALKLLLPGKPSGRERMIREAKAMARLSHPNVVTVHEVGTLGDRVFVAMEFVHGPTLREWLEQRRGVEEILGVFRQAAVGLDAAHRVGLVHRDFKPDNVLIGDDGWVKVADFGLAKAADLDAVPTEGEAASSPETIHDVLTRTGHLLGTPAYMAPEQFLGRPVGVPGDVFSFCVALYEALTGRRPYAGEDAVAVYDNASAGRREPLRASGLPAKVIAFVERGLAPDPDARPDSLAAFLEALEADAPRARGRVLRSVAAAAIAAALAGGVASGLVAVTRAVKHDDGAPVVEATKPVEDAQPPAKQTIAALPAEPEPEPPTCTTYIADRSDPSDARARADRAADDLDGIDLRPAAHVPRVLDAAKAMLDADRVDHACAVLTGYLTTDGDPRDPEARCLFAQACAGLTPSDCQPGAKRMGTAGCVLGGCTRADTPAAMHEACEAGEAACCFGAALKTSSPRAAFTDFVDGCQAGSAASCAHAALTSSAVERLEPVAFWAWACVFGLRQGCEMVRPGGVTIPESELECLQSVGLPGCSFGNEDPEQLRYMAAHLIVRAEFPSVLDGQSLRPRAESLGFTTAEVAKLEDAEERFLRHVLASLHAIVPRVGGRISPPVARLPTGDVRLMDAEISGTRIEEQLARLRARLIDESRFGEERWQAVAQRIADERAGFAEPPADADIGPEERFFRLEVGLGEMLEDFVAEEIGRERAHTLRIVDGGWPGSRHLHSIRGS